MSIKQSASPDVLPDFRNLGVVARILVGVNAAALAAAAYVETGWRQVVERFVREAVVVEPALIFGVFMLYVAAPWLRRLTYLAGCAAVAAVTLGLATATAYVAGRLAPFAVGTDMVKLWVFTLLATAVLLEYLRLRTRAFSPALVEARLQALQARIRPHFLFNT